MADILSVAPAKYNSKLAEALKEVDEFEEPSWIFLVKSSPHKVRPIHEPDFWYKRAASILRQIYIKKIVGVGRLRNRYGGRKKRGVKPEHFVKSSGKMIRVILQQSEKAGFIEKAQGKKAGRQLTQHGIKFMEDLV